MARFCYVSADEVLHDSSSQTYLKDSNICGCLVFAALGIDGWLIRESHLIHAVEVRTTMRNGDLLLLSTIE